MEKEYKEKIDKILDKILDGIQNIETLEFIYLICKRLQSE